MTEPCDRCDKPLRFVRAATTHFHVGDHVQVTQEGRRYYRDEARAEARGIIFKLHIHSQHEDFVTGYWIRDERTGREMALSCELVETDFVPASPQEIEEAMASITNTWRTG